MERAALYIRVSTEEQAMHGYSLEAQRDTLTAYAKKHNLFIVDYYIDDGKSARKRYTSRPEFMRMLEDVKQDRLDVILFIKLDRWFRSVKDYYQVQDILEAHHVNWVTTEERYDTCTTNGRLNINIRLTIAQDEADRTSDRIKYVFASKLARKEALTGKLPPGLKIVDKHLVPDPDTADMVRDLFHHYAEHGSKHGAVTYIFDTYGVKIDRHTFQKMLHNTLYKGVFRGIEDYCEPLIDPELFDRLNAIKNVRAAPTGRVYIFSGLMVCAGCGSHMTGRHSSNKGGQEYIYYRCNRYSNFKDCSNSKLANEAAIEAWLLEHIEDEINAYLITIQVKEKERKRPQTDRAAIKRKLARLKELYVNDLIDMRVYKEDYERYTALLAERPAPAEPETNLQALRDFLNSGFKETYERLDREKRRALWRSIIKEIRVDAAQNYRIFFV